MKAMLIVFRIAVPKTHDLEKLAELLSASAPDFAGRIFELTDLTTWYINARYPTQNDHLPSRSDVISKLSKLRALRLQIDSLASKR